MKVLKLNFMIPGHTNFKCDDRFGLIKKLYRKTTVDCVDHIIELVKKYSSAKLNKAQCYENGKGFQYLDLNYVLKIFFKKLNGLQKYQHFIFEAANPGIVKTQTVANGSFTEFNLWRNRKINVFEITKEIKYFSILVLTPPPLDYKRQKYLYHNIRPFIRNEFKDNPQPNIM